MKIIEAEPEDVIAYLDDANPDALYVGAEPEEYADALIGWTYDDTRWPRESRLPVAVYDAAVLRELLAHTAEQERPLGGEEDAWVRACDWYSHNVECAWQGEGTPAFHEPDDDDDEDEDEDD